VLCDERRLEVEGVGDAEVGVKAELSLRKDEDRAVCAGTVALVSRGISRGEEDIISYPMLGLLFEKPMASWKATRRAV
jgi:hypothetical protein